MEGSGSGRLSGLAAGVRTRLSVWRLVSDLRMPRWLPEVLVLGILYGIYEASRGLLEADLPTALANGHDILQWERAWHLAPEHVLNQLLQHSTALAVACSYYYAALHYLVTPLVLIWMYRRRAAYYPFARLVLVLSTALALIGYYVLPTAPPRLLPGSGIIDTLATVQQYGWWDAAGSVPRGMTELSNQYAAMPSLHVGWALWCGVLVAVYARRLWVRVLGGLYPMGTTFAVLATGNHYLLDTLAGAATMLLGAGLAVAWVRVRRRRRPPDVSTRIDESASPAAV